MTNPPILRFSFLSVLVALIAASFVPAQDHPIVRIGVVIDGPFFLGSTRVDQLSMFRDEIQDLTRGEFDVRFPDELQFIGDFEAAGIRAGLDRLLNDPRVDLVLTLGPFSTAEACRRRDLPRPVVAATGFDAQSQGFPVRVDDNGNRVSGVPNLNYISWTGIIRRDLERFRALVPFETVTFIQDPLIYEFVPDLNQFVAGQVAELGIGTAQVPGSSRADEILAQLDSGVEAVYLTPLIRLPNEERIRLIEGLKELRIPSFSLLGRTEVDMGILAGVSPKEDNVRKARRVAINVHRILLGENAGDLPVLLTRLDQLTINMETARAIGWSPTWQIMTTAELLHEKPEVEGRRLTLTGAVREAVERNLDLQVSGRAVAAGAQNISAARSRFFPQLDGTVGGSRIDSDRAALSTGASPEDRVTGGLTLSQFLYSDGLLADFQVSRDLQESLELSYEVLRLDVALEAATAYLNLLRAQTLERIERENLDLTGRNLDIARRRLDIGVANSSEVYRWESQIASDRQDLITSGRRVDISRVDVNRVLHRPLEDRFFAEDTGLSDPDLITSRADLFELIDNQAGFDRFRDFQVREGMGRSPELNGLDAAIAAQERTVLATRRAFWTPDVSLFGELEYEFDRGGDGTSFILPPGVGAPDDTDWVVGIEASLPLFTGGLRGARSRQAREDLAGLRIGQMATAERVEQRIRNSLFAAAATYPAIQLSQEGAQAARRNLELVTDTYEQGVVSILDLLDAQNQALVAEQNSANAVYDFLIDLMGVQRATSNFDFFTSDAERDAWFDRLKRFMEEPTE